MRMGSTDKILDFSKIDIYPSNVINNSASLFCVE